MTELINIPAQLERGNAQASVAAISPFDGHFDQWLTIRQEFMESQGWHYGDDFDAYDDDASTLHLVNLKQNDIEFGLRLTPRSNIEETLSWSWLPEEMQYEARQNYPAAENHEVWDLTRLVPGKVDAGRAKDSIAELLGAGLELTSSSELAPRWIFATTVPFLRYFNQHGIEFTPIVRGRFSPGDKYESVLCYADPVERTTYLHNSTHDQSAETYYAVERGRRAMLQGRAA